MAKESQENTMVLLARVEGEDSIFPIEERLTAEMFRTMVANYDAESRPAPVISGYDAESGTAIPAHAGEHLPPLGSVKSLGFDGLNLWGEIAEIDERVTAKVVDGFLQRSISFWRHHPEVKGEPYLRHVAIMGGEQPGIPNMPPLDNYFQAQHGEERGSHLANMPYETRSILDRPYTYHSGEAREKEGVTMDDDLKQEMRTLVGDLFKEHQEKAATPSEPETRSAPEEPNPEDRPVTAADLRALTEQLTAQTKLTAEALSEAHAIRAGDRSHALTSKLDIAVRTGKMTPADRAIEEQHLTELAKLAGSEAVIEARLTAIAEKAPVFQRDLTQPTETRQRCAPGSDVFINMRKYTLPKGPGARTIDQEALAILKAAKAEAGTEGTKEEQYLRMRSAAYAASGEFDGGDI